MLVAVEFDATFLNPPPGYMTAITDEDLAKKPLLDAGWACGKENRPCAHILINTSDALLCVPAETKDGCLMIPLEHFRLLAGCGLKTGMDGKTRLVKYDRVYLFDMEKGALLWSDEARLFPVAPYTAHGVTYVPLRALCEALGLEIRWRETGGNVLLNSPWVDIYTLQQYMAVINKTILTALEEQEAASAAAEPAPLVYGEPMVITVTFYYSSRDPAYTASGNQAVAGSIAADSSLPFGTQIYIPELDFICENGVFTVHDRGSQIKGNTIDVFLPNDIRKDPAVAAALRRGRYTVTGYQIG